MRSLVEKADSGELHLSRLPRAPAVDDVVPVGRDDGQSLRRISEPAQEIRVRDCVGSLDERTAVAKLGRGRAVQKQADAESRVGRVIAEAAAQRLDRMPDRMRVPEVDEQRAADAAMLPPW
jgi:hypothetical protein